MIFIFAIILGKIHIVTGGSVGPKFISRESFGFSEMFINVDKITGMPWISAQTKYPLGCKALAREGIIETDQEFKTRTKQEIQEDIDKITREALEEYDRAMEDLE